MVVVCVPDQEWIQSYASLIQYPSTRRSHTKHGDENIVAAGDINAVHGESFIQKFPEAEQGSIQSFRALDTQLVTILTGLRSLDWRRKVKSLEQVRGLVACGAEQREECVQILTSHTHTVRACLADSRTQVVRDCCLTVAYLAQECGLKAVPVILQLLPLLLKLLQHKSKFIISSGVVCIRFIIQHTFSPRFPPIICKGVFCSDTTVRRLTQEFLHHILHTWPLHILHQQLHTLQQALQAGLVDADASTRLRARPAFLAFSAHFCVEAELVVVRVLSCVSAPAQHSADTVRRRAQVRAEYAELHRARARRRGTRLARAGLTDSAMSWSSISTQSTVYTQEELYTLHRLLGTPESTDSGIAQGTMDTDDEMVESGDERAMLAPKWKISTHAAILALLAAVTRGGLAESMAAARDLVKMVQGVQMEQVEPHLKEIVTELKKGYNHHQPRVRRCAVTCLASLARVVGYSVICTHMGDIRRDKRRLLRLYVERVGEGDQVDYRSM